jgi:1-deoxy-D-xylulose-5-phosphate reductoisomerase
VPAARLSLPELGGLTFEPADEAAFPALALARVAGEAGGTWPAVFNAANETANLAFRERRIGFNEIAGVLEHTLERVAPEPVHEVADVIRADAAARAAARRWVERATFARES